MVPSLGFWIVIFSLLWSKTLLLKDVWITITSLRLWLNFALLFRQFYRLKPLISKLLNNNLILRIVILSLFHREIFKLSIFIFNQVSNILQLVALHFLNHLHLLHFKFFNIHFILQILPSLFPSKILSILLKYLLIT